MNFEEEKPKLRQKLRDLIIRVFQFKNRLSITEVRELLDEIPELTGPDPLSGAAIPDLKKKCPDCKTEMRHSADYSHHLIDIFNCPKCGCRIEVIHSKQLPHLTTPLTQLE
jgi:hypothetical protein